MKYCLRKKQILTSAIRSLDGIEYSYIQGFEMNPDELLYDSRSGNFTLSAFPFASSITF